MNLKSAELRKIGEPFAAGIFEEPDHPPFLRYARALRRYYEDCIPFSYHGELLYPSGEKFNKPIAVRPDYAFTFSINAQLLREKSEEAFLWMKEEEEKLGYLSSPHTIGGACFTHGIPNFSRIVREGFNSYEKRIAVCPNSRMREGLTELLSGIRDFHSRSRAYLREMHADSRLQAALERVPFKPAGNLYEAIVCWNFVYYLDLCDNPGPLDTGLLPFYRGEDVTQLLHAFFKNVNENCGWVSTLGPQYNPLTLQCMKAAAGLRRPSLELRVTKEMPEDVWKASEELLLSGGGQPAFYNEVLYQKALHERFPKISREDLLKFSGGGCSETMLAGISNVGSLDAGIHLMLIFEEAVLRNPETAKDFEECYALFFKKAQEEIHRTAKEVNRYKKLRAKVRPNPMRTLLVDDCIDRGLDFTDGGARYSWSVVNVAGLINVIESFLSIRELVYRKKKYSPKDFFEKLRQEDETLYSEIKKCPHYGADDPDADALAARTAGDVWSLFEAESAWPDTVFLPASIQFATYADAGRRIGASPDGRKSGEVLCDSLGAIFGNDTKGPTAMLCSAAKLVQEKATGTPIMNLRLSREHVQKALRPLVTGYFAQGGMQLQITCVSREELLDAQRHPEKHETLVVRIGGFSEYFNNLSPELQKSVIDRTEH